VIAVPSKKPESLSATAEYTDVHERGYAVLPKKLVSLADAAECAGVHPRTLRRQIAAGHLRAVRVGRNIKIDLNDLEAIFKPVGGAAAS
jgi:excisionase family DNA binding protein